MVKKSDAGFKIQDARKSKGKSKIEIATVVFGNFAMTKTGILPAKNHGGPPPRSSSFNRTRVQEH